MNSLALVIHFCLLVAAGLAASAASSNTNYPPPLEGDYVAHDFHFRSGETLPELRLHYLTFGTPVRDKQGVVRNAILILHGTGGSCSQFLRSDFANELYGKGQPFDVTRYYLVIPDGIGHGKSSKPSDGLRAKFPQYGYQDMIAAQHQLVTDGLHVNHLRLVFGTSMGGMHTWLWGETYPDFMDALMPMASLPTQISGRNRAWRRIVIDAIRNDPEWHNGEYQSQPPSLRTASEVSWFMGSNPILRYKDTSTLSRTDAALDRYVSTNALGRLDANNTLYAYEASHDYDPGPGLENISAPLLAINSADDLINPPELGILEREIKRVKHGKAIVLPLTDQTVGHGSHTKAVLWEKLFGEVFAEDGTEIRSWQGGGMKSNFNRTERGIYAASSSPGFAVLKLSGTRRDSALKRHECRVPFAGFSRFALGLLFAAALIPIHAQTPDDLSRIRDEGLNHSQVMEMLSHLTETIGPRLTGSPNLKRANEWTRDQFVAWGLTNAQLEPWGPFGRGWAAKRFSAQIVGPGAFPLIAYPKAWSPGLKEPVTADVIYLNARNEEDLEQYRGKLKGAIVMTSPVREVNPRFEPLSSRLGEAELLQLANVSDPRYTAPYEGGRNRGGGGTNNSPTAPGARRGGGGFGRGAFAGRLIGFAMEQGAVAAASSSTEGDGGAVFVSSATLPGGGRSNAPFAGPRIWSTNAPANLPQFAIGSEDYNRLLRILQPGGKLKMAVDMDVQFYDDDLMVYNTIAEIPGTDLKREIVMLGGHLDSWHAGTGATDNGAGVAAAMEAVRIIKALKLQPRRTIRVALWTGEEQGLMGSRAYVSNHFGYFPGGGGARGGGRAGAAGGDDSTRTDSTEAPRARDAAAANPEERRNLVRKREYDSLSVYLNLDHGAGKIRGIYLEGNEAARPIFSQWLRPLADLGANTITLSRSGGTDQVPFDSIGLPGFPFIQDPLDYWTRTHHSSADVLDRVPPGDLKQAATVLAVCTYSAAMADKKVPRKPLE